LKNSAVALASQNMQADQKINTNNKKSPNQISDRMEFSKPNNSLVEDNKERTETLRDGNTPSIIVTHDPDAVYDMDRLEKENRPSNLSQQNKRPKTDKGKTRNPIKRYESILQPLPKLRSMDNLLKYTIHQPVSIKQKRYWSPYLFASSMHNPTVRPMGWGIGAGVEYGTEDISLFLEGGYTNLNFRQGTNMSIGDEQEVLSPELSSGEIDLNTVLQYENAEIFLNGTDFSSLITNTHELRLTAGIRKVLLGRLRVNASIAYVRMISAINQDFTLDVSSRELFNMDTGNTFALNVASNELFETGIYRKYDIVPRLGLEYAVLPNVHLGLSYEHGLLNIISAASTESFGIRPGKNTNDALYRNNLSLQLRVAF